MLKRIYTADVAFRGNAQISFTLGKDETMEEKLLSMLPDYVGDAAIEILDVAESEYEEEPDE